MKKGAVVVGYLHDGTWSASFGKSLCRLYMADASGNARIVGGARELAVYCTTGGLVAGRNSVARSFLDDTDGEWLFMVDADMGFEPDTVERLIASADVYARPVMGGLCFAHKRMFAGPLHTEVNGIIPTIYEFIETETEVGFNRRMDYARDQVVVASGTGAACLLIHRRALNAIRAKYGDCWFDTITHPKGPTTFSEDLSFCLRLAGCDLPLHIHTGVKTSHHKGGVYLDEDAFDRQMAFESFVRAQEPEKVSA